MLTTSAPYNTTQEEVSSRHKWGVAKLWQGRIFLWKNWMVR